MKKSLLLLILAIIFLSGCVPQTMYYWENYSHTLYNYKKDPGDEALAKHKNCIENIISKSNSWNKKVPPGVYCEYGYYLIMEGNIEGGLEYLDLEVNEYPESQKFVQTLKDQLLMEKENFDE